MDTRQVVTVSRGGGRHSAVWISGAPDGSLGRRPKARHIAPVL